MHDIPELYTSAFAAGTAALQLRPGGRSSVVVLCIALLAIGLQNAQCEEVDSSRPPFVGLHLSDGIGVNSVSNSDLSIYDALTYRNLDLSYTLSFMTNVGSAGSAFFLLGPYGALRDIGFQIGRLHTTTFTYWGYSGGVSMVGLSRRTSNERGMFASSDTMHLSIYGAGLIGQFSAGVSLYHIIGIGVLLFGILNTIQPYVAAMITFQFGYI